jgi:hypothetical protein
MDMTPEEYLRIFSQQLKGFSPEEQASLIEEIGSHIESLEQDLGTEKNPEKRREKMMSKLGSPQEMSKGFKMIYRPDRIIEFLFVALPFLLYPLVNIILQNMFGIEYVVRAEVILYSTLILIGLWRQSILVTLFWATMIIAQIISMLLVGYAFYGSAQSLLWLVYAIGLVFLVAKIVWQSRNDLLIVVFACLPLVICAYGSAFVLTYPQNMGSHLFGFLDKLLLNLYMMSGSGNGGYFQYFGYIIALALFFLFTNRDIRWLALVMFGLIDTLSRSFLNLHNGLMSPWVYSLYILIPLVTVFLGWRVERNERKQVSLAV